MNKIDDYKPGMIVYGRVSGIQPYGAFVSFGEDVSGLIHISELSNGFVRDVNKFVNINDYVMVKVIDVDKKNELVQIEYRDDPWWDCVIYKMLEEWEKTTFVTNGKEARLCLYNKKDENEEWDIAYTTDDIANKLVMNDIETRTWESMEIVSKDEENNIVELQIVGKIENNHAETIGSYLEQGMLDNEDLLNIPESREAYEQCLNENKFEMHLWIDLDREVPIKSEVDVTLIWQLDYYAFPVVGEDLPEKVMYVVIYEPNEFEDIVLPVLP